MGWNSFKFGIITLILSSTSALAAGKIFSLSLQDAEHLALESSNQLKALNSSAEAASEHADSQYAYLFPKLSFDAKYQYVTHVPVITFPLPGNPSTPFGTHDSYSYGPVLSYTLWDTGASRDAYHGAKLQADSRREDQKNAALQTLLNVRAAYVRLQLANEELRLLGSSLELSRNQNKDIESNFRAGAATKLDKVDSQRDVINYELQFTQKQTEVALDLKDLLALVQIESSDLNRPNPGDISLDPLSKSLQEAGAWIFSPPTNNQPSIRSQAALAESAERVAASEKSLLYPSLQLSASATRQYPDQNNLRTVNQNTVLLSLSMPIFEFNRTRHLVEEANKQSEAARFNEEQTRINLSRDYHKSLEELANLREEQKLSLQDVEHSEEAARLYYQSYKGGKTNLIDVQSANNRELLARVNAARIDAQILNQLFSLRYISGEAINGQ